jgi:hypothetical protein
MNSETKHIKEKTNEPIDNLHIANKDFIGKFLLDLILEFNFKENFQYNCYKSNIKNQSVEIDKKFSNPDHQNIIDTTIIKNMYIMNTVKNKIQNGGGLCGFHCIFNSINYLKYIKSREKGDIFKMNYYLEKMNSSPKFWIFYNRILKYLLNSNLVGESDKNLLKQTGPLERYQFKLLLQHMPYVIKKVSDDENNTIKYFSFFFAFNFIQMDRADVLEFQKSLNYFREYNGEKNLVYLILMGITNHWSVMILENKKGNITFNYIDSTNNYDVFKLKTKENVIEYLNYLCSQVTDINSLNIKDGEEINEYVEQKLAEISKYRKPPTGWLKKCFYQWISDINISVKILFKIVHEGYSLYDTIIESFLIRFTHTFEEFNNLLLCKRETIDDFIKNELNIIDNSEIRKKEKLTNIRNNLKFWLENEYHPRIIQSDFLRQIETFNNEETTKKTLTYIKFENLVYYCKKIENLIFQNVEQDLNTNELLRRFYDILDILIIRFKIIL